MEVTTPGGRQFSVATEVNGLNARIVARIGNREIIVVEGITKETVNSEPLWLLIKHMQTNPVLVDRFATMANDLLTKVKSGELRWKEVGEFNTWREGEHVPNRVSRLFRKTVIDYVFQDTKISELAFPTEPVRKEEDDERLHAGGPDDE
jgi:hypothetical protein